ncbi:hypothetical protein [Flammeovirga sp. OC4]|uniref:hypothetical protein n=1 Tax=Flammeovirga sp. OC4 TaxID=1382345 RepID=UPI0005C72BCE|nr:hypothetical protein [Flammeovirga sp. OC4]
MNSDLHCHPSLKATLQRRFNNGDGNIWRNYKTQLDEVFKKESHVTSILKDLIYLDSQSNLQKCVQGKVKVVFFAIYPIERSFFRKIVGINGLLSVNKAISVLTGLPLDKVGAYRNNEKFGVDYYKDYQFELETILLKENQSFKDSNGVKWNFKIPKNKTEYQQYLNEQNTIIGVLTVEGGHSFGDYEGKKIFRKNKFNKEYSPYLYPTEDNNSDINNNSELKHLRKSLLNNIEATKKSAHPPLFLTLGHHFNNLICGHAKSFKGALGMLLNQKALLGLGITTIGNEVIDLLLDDSIGKRILIDIKHMSIQARHELYKKQQYKNNKTPIVSSHSSVSGIDTLANASNIINSNKKEKRFLAQQEIGLTDEEIKTIFLSKGLIGICLHEGRMPGKRFKQLKKEYQRNREATKELNLFYCLFISTLLHIMKVQKEILGTQEGESRKIWSGIGVGTDYDGIVDPFDNVQTLKDLDLFKQGIKQYIQLAYSGDPDYWVVDPCTDENVDVENIKSLFDINELDNLIDDVFFNNTHSFIINNL